MARREKHAVAKGVVRLIAGMMLGSQSIVTLAESFPDISIPFEAESVGGAGVYYFQGISGVPDSQNEGFTANAGFVVTGESVVVFDALGTPSLGVAMIKAIQEKTDLPISHVVISHYHADHIYGLQAFRAMTDAQILAHQSGAGYVDSLAAQQRLSQRREALSPWVNEDTRLIAPDKTFESDVSLELGDYRFSIVHAGPAHAPDDTLMMVEPAGVLFSGDIIQSGRIPYLASSTVNSENWMKAIEQVRELSPRYLVPGHGAASENAIEALNFTFNYLSYVREAMGEAVENWLPFEEAYAQTDWSRYEGLPAFDASNRANAYRVFLEMEQAALGGS
ncbi:MBL fold metallo-hydrolase [Marinobacter sp. F4216]|uniref:MBL fold metallo-hydrolase n=1 Tax=Marinobacter sp. F4216 TaxID=2874281 RepID=UPI001CBC4D5D|nr:MBL fold metallo-hydrolase [Marinobacter sp. F4216]MBZ2168062.1 MBL fold metallo-hydrolase [Marinobacter sp. F4216]